jgi:pimeloyl-ACP methyl ester carboxylesterase
MPGLDPGIHGQQHRRVQNLRKYGTPPYSMVVIHGGPGAVGEMAPVAREFAKTVGVLEPLQTKSTIEGQIEELKDVLEANAELPVTLIGHSWGAWLSVMLTAQFPQLVLKLILIASAPYEEKYAAEIRNIRLNRLNDWEQADLHRLEGALLQSTGRNTAELLARMEPLFEKTDSYDAIPGAAEHPEFNEDIYAGIWPEAVELRRSGKLLELAGKIRCAVVAIHGDFDPHPAEGVKEPLAKAIENFRFILLKNCGHTPWIERDARERFYRLLAVELN